MLGPLVTIVRLLLTVHNSHRNELRYQQRQTEKHRLEHQREYRRQQSEIGKAQLRAEREKLAQQKRAIKLLPLSARHLLVSVKQSGPLSIQWADVETLFKLHLLTADANGQIVLSKTGQQYLTITEGMSE